MRHNHQREIDGNTWIVNEFSATEGLRLLASLTRLGGGAVAKAIEALPADGSILGMGLNMGLLAAAVADLANRLNEDEVVDLVKRLLATTLCDGKEVARQFDVVFQGRYLTLFKVVGFSLEVNYKLPLADLLAAASGADEQEKATA